MAEKAGKQKVSRSKYSGAIAVFGGFGTKKKKFERIVGMARKRGLAARVFYDPERELFLRGAPDLPSADAMRERLIKLRDNHGGLATLGFSGGGFGALKYGIECGAHTIVGHNAFTTFDDAACKLAPENLIKTAERLRVLEPDDRRRNIRFLLEEAGYGGRIVLNYSALRWIDAYMALNLSNLPGVELVPLMEKSHAFHDFDREVPLLLDQIAPAAAEAPEVVQAAE